MMKISDGEAFQNFDMARTESEQHLLKALL
jgi:hypothetical protein